MGKEQPYPKVSVTHAITNNHCIHKFFRTVMHFLSPSRRSPDAVILEGRRLITDAINAGFYPSLFVFSRIKCLKDIPFDLSRSHEMYQIPFTNIAAWSELKSPPGIMGKIGFSGLTRIRTALSDLLIKHTYVCDIQVSKHTNHDFDFQRA